jgi:hypothetical protein
MTFLKTSDTQLKGLIKPSEPWVAILVDKMMRNESTMTELRFGTGIGGGFKTNDDLAAFAASLEQNTTLQILQLGEFALFCFCSRGVWITFSTIEG